MRNTIAERIARQMKSLGMSQRDLSAESTIPLATISRKLRTPAAWTIEELERIADAMGFNPFADDNDEDVA